MPYSSSDESYTYFHILSVCKIVSAAESGNPKLVFFGNNRTLCHFNFFCVYLFCMPILAITRNFGSSYDMHGGNNVSIPIITIDTDILNINAHSEERMDNTAFHFV